MALTVLEAKRKKEIKSWLEVCELHCKDHFLPGPLLIHLGLSGSTDVRNIPSYSVLSELQVN